MSAPDYRIRFPSAAIDFVNDVGETGQDHDQIPAPGQQARYDWFRMYLIGLLSNQASPVAPTQYRQGTLWLDTSVPTVGPVLKIRRQEQWLNLSEAIDLGGTTLQDWYDSVSLSLTSLSPELFFYGSVTENNRSDIAIPSNLIPYVSANTRAFVTINGESDTKTKYILGPDKVSVISNTIVRLNTILLEAGDTFAVSLRLIPSETFHTSPVIVN